MIQNKKNLSIYGELTERQNPQFRQITTKYLFQRKERKQVDQRKMTISNQVKHFKKMNQSLQKSLQQKQRQLQWLKQVRQRYLANIQNKKDKQEQNRLKLQQLRMQNTTMRQKSIQNIHDALDQLHRKKSRAHNDVVKNLDHLKKIFSEKKQRMDETNQSVYQQMRRSKIKGKNHINKFFRKKNTELTRTYKSMLHDQQNSFIEGIKQIQNLNTKQSRYKDKISKKQHKMNKVLQQIQGLRKSSHEIALGIMRSSRFTTTFNSKVSRTQRTEQESQNQIKFGGKKNLMLHVTSGDSLLQQMHNPEQQRK